MKDPEGIHTNRWEEGQLGRENGKGEHSVSEKEKCDIREYKTQMSQIEIEERYAAKPEMAVT